MPLCTFLGDALVGVPGSCHPAAAILGRHTFAVSLEAAVVARDLNPPAEIAREIDRVRRLGHTQIADRARNEPARWEISSA